MSACVGLLVFLLSFWAGLAVLVMPGCSTTDPPPTLRQASAPLYRDVDHFLVPVWLNGHEAMMVLDTGASDSILTPEAASRMGLTPNGRVTAIGGIGGLPQSAQFANVRVFSVGGISVPQSEIVIAHIMVSPGSDGLLGDDVLNNLDIDLPHRLVREPAYR